MDADNDGKQRLTVISALADLQTQIDRFQNEVDICREERLGRVEISRRDIMHSLVYVAKQILREYLDLNGVPPCVHVL